jgi:hypothetical protein
METPYRLPAHRPTSAESASSVLGPPVRSYYGAKPRVILAAAPFVLLLGYGVWLAHGMGLEQWFFDTFSVATVAVLLTCCVVLIVYTSAIGDGELLRVHAGGLLDLRVEQVRPIGAPKAIRWDEIESLTAVGSDDGRAVRRHVVRTYDGTRVSLGPIIGGVGDLVEEIRVRVTERQLPEVCARVAQGGVVRFGVLSASERGVTLSHRLVAWEDVGGIATEAAELVIRGRAGERVAATAVGEVPNAFLLGEMARLRREGGAA